MKKPIVLVIMDGVGRGDGGPGDAVKQANTPTLDKLMATCPMTWLKAHGTAVGLPTDDDMGNSEVGHNALGCGQIYSQGAKLVQESIETGSLYQSKTWVELTDNCLQNGKALHFIGLLSDGNVHSNISHLIAMLTKAREMGLKKVYCHILLDGRDVPATSALEYVDQLEAVLASLSDAEHEYKIASGGGRMVITMDRYEANWPMVEKGWRTHVQGEGRQFASAKEAIETYRAENPGMIDQDLLPFVIAKDGQPVAKIANGDSVILFNFRGDRAQEISLAFDRKDFDHFDRGDYTGVKFAGMLEYDGDLKIPMHYLVEPPVIRNTLTEVLCKAGVHEYAVSETQKYGHVTYFWNGNRSGKVDESLEDYAEVPSDVIPFEQAPAMKSVEITDLLVEAMASHKYQFLRCNYPNGDMVGHRRSERRYHGHGGRRRGAGPREGSGRQVRLHPARHRRPRQRRPDARNEEGQDQRAHRALPEPRSLHHLRSGQQVRDQGRPLWPCQRRADHRHHDGPRDPRLLAAEHDLSFIPNRRGILPRLFPTFVLRRYLSHAKEALNPYDSDPGAGAAVRLRQDAG